VISITTRKPVIVIIIVVLLAAGAWAGYSTIHAHTPIRIGVLLPMTGDVNLRDPLEWAKDTINQQGGIGGRPIELVYRDTGSGNTTELAQELLSDDSIRIVIGPPTSDDVYALAPAFIQKQKLLISPLATSGDIIRAFGGESYFWRTAQGDVAQVKVLVSLLRAKGVNRAALLAENTSYGDTFYDWTGFFATESGIDLPSVQQFDPGTLDADVAGALSTNPDTIIAACGPADAARIKTDIDRSGKPVTLFLTDAAATPVLISSLGAGAEGLEGTSPTADPSSGFTAAYQQKFGEAPTDYAAPTYDALLLAAYTSARQDAAPFEPLAGSIRHIVTANGTHESWDAQGSKDAISAILRGGNPYITGASGPLDYDPVHGVDPLVTYYSHWTVENGSFRTVGVFGSAKAGTSKTSGESPALSQASGSLMATSSPGGTPYIPPVNRTNFEAIVVGPSSGWNNYRHESDALAVYTLLRGNGVPDDHIILMLYDDVPDSPQNPFRGNVHNLPGGANLRANAEVDYSGKNVTTDTFMNVLTGNKTPETPIVLSGNAGTDVFVYIASHGSPGSIIFPDPSVSAGQFTTGEFTTITNTMYKEGKYRQMVFFVDTCFGESIADNVTAKGVLYFTGANSGEPSLGAVYDPQIHQWLSDEFTENVLDAIRADPGITFRDLYTTTYERVTGSHVQMLNTQNFGDINVPVMKFL
jgi:ABC-type branched-subunit amino acid transport system substrate-binding protein